MADFTLHWHGSLHLEPCQTRIYKVDLELIPDEPGIYIFLRGFGTSKLPMYLGQATNLQRRIKQQLETNVRLMNGIRNSPQGRREVVFGVFQPRRGQRLNSSLDRIERALIRHYIRSGFQLFNTQGIKVAMETLTSDRSQQLNKLIPRTLSFEKAG